MDLGEASRLLAHQLATYNLHPPRKIGHVKFVSGVFRLVRERKQATDVLSVAAKPGVDVGRRYLIRRHPPTSAQGLLHGGACRMKE
jgi:hypothetical protein